MNIPRLAAAGTGAITSGGLLQLLSSMTTNKRDPGGPRCNTVSYSASIGWAGHQAANIEPTRTIRQKPSNRQSAAIRTRDFSPQPRLAQAKNATPDGSR